MREFEIQTFGWFGRTTVHPLTVLLSDDSACYGVLRFIMESGAKGCEVVVSGKLRAARAKSMKFTDGFMIHSGQPVISSPTPFSNVNRSVTLSIPLPATFSFVKVSSVSKSRSSPTNSPEARARNLSLMLSSSSNPRKSTRKLLASHVRLTSILVQLRMSLLQQSRKDSINNISKVDILKLDISSKRFINRQFLDLHN